VRAEDWDRRYEEAELVWTPRPNRFLVEEVSGLQARTALDLACGEGRHAVWLAELGWVATGVDWSTVAIERGRRLAEARGVTVDWVVADLNRWQPAGAAWDLVLVFYLQLEPDERRAVLEKAARAVAPDGTFLLVGHDTRNLDGGYGGPKSDRVLYTPDDIVADLAESRLEIERAEPVKRPVETPEGERIAIDALVRASRAPRAS
jgi:SAM-dependent methyltransferase